ncbi:recombinase family protein [Salibaculum griseiflavum]|uniref:Resolvase n=1 Tax=Salibaculum griseiflavum TaxID=1914409 RepID=A0A2V1P5M1_9RHOB|nr:recombinase family protein [Salibaculum griseiflavum]PWG17801.1 resolvase [Salibaculum griseiflavum]
MAVYGYARVSSLSQSTDVQEQKLKEAGCSVIRMEKVSGASVDGRDELRNLLDFITEGDTLVVYKLDRLGRSTRDVLNIVHELDQKGAFLRVLDRSIDTSKPEGRLILTVLSMVSEMELSFIKERQRAGIDKAKAEGKYKGRPTSIDTDKLIELKEQGLGATHIARELGCTRSAVYKALDRLNA